MSGKLRVGANFEEALGTGKREGLGTIVRAVTVARRSTTKYRRSLVMAFGRSI